MSKSSLTKGTSDLCEGLDSRPKIDELARPSMARHSAHSEPGRGDSSFSSDRYQERSSQNVWVWPIVLERSGEEVGRLAVDRKPAHAHPRPSSNEAPSLPSRDHTLRHARRVRPPSKVNRKFAGTSFVHVTCRHAPLFVRLWTTQSTPNEWPIKKILASFSTRVRRALRLSSMISHCLP